MQSVRAAHAQERACLVVALHTSIKRAVHFHEKHVSHVHIYVYDTKYEPWIGGGSRECARRAVSIAIDTHKVSAQTRNIRIYKKSYVNNRM